ncbi:MAG: YbgC/FadM family acyl-CoA thioesterase [Rhodospirillaceae bacterium]|jgi:acyl-CoA thioester hydrolase|nr:YbgC/FadM family acyl-CoA thioesterase [Rhodospirillaceae bacterium]MBT3883198.1 YbgC/FadM family acyl-CoA thioesterase [Rhodospirillaceae bacterium]MBT4118693.1 YbgC/FadM family acyl-CoA thioesterase [Rhodospirillaceae bacterium]MBT4674179.1 YbgC/FadM family acyl-CoA thioesterase [Rhodospirillaceae bacterium]MBT4751976.1 YbgC/FadM family acyl-CoA thioesterase [Rhodospirillaceae bacterium]
MNNLSKSQAGNQTQNHIHALRVYWEDTDAAGIVYYANYLKYTERARSEILYAAGIDQTEMRETGGVVLAVRACNTEYHLPARLGDQLEVHTAVIAVKGASFELRQTVMRGIDALVVMDVRLACIDPISGKPARLPAQIKAVLSGTKV